MFEDPISHTALLTAAARAAESQRPSPLFIDALAGQLAGARGEEALRSSPYGDILVAALAVRTRLFDDAVVAAVRGGASQVVLVAAGLDTRAWRLDLPADVRWFEIDHASVLDYKAGVLGTARPKVRRTAVACDLRTDDVAAALAAAGFDRSASTAVIVEGLLMYLPPEAIDPLLRTLAALVPAGSAFLADIPNAAALDPSGVMGPFLDRLAKGGAPWRFGTDDPKALLARSGWTLDDAVFAGHVRAHPERMPWPAVEAAVPGQPFSWLVRASRART